MDKPTIILLSTPEKETLQRLRSQFSATVDEIVVTRGYEQKAFWRVNFDDTHAYLIKVEKVEKVATDQTVDVVADTPSDERGKQD